MERLSRPGRVRPGAGPDLQIQEPISQSKTGKSVGDKINDLPGRISPKWGPPDCQSPLGTLRQKNEKPEGLNPASGHEHFRFCY
jgi:hypothetical protein